MNPWVAASNQIEKLGAAFRQTVIDVLGKVSNKEKEITVTLCMEFYQPQEITVTLCMEFYQPREITVTLCMAFYQPREI